MTATPMRRCEWEGCCGAGEFPAPRSRVELHNYRWFCLEHVRAYNATWNYYAGMDEREIEADVRADVVWRRMTWRFGGRTDGAASPPFGAQVELDDPFDLFREDTSHEPPAAPPSVESRALRVLDLVPPVTLAVVKARYKELVKRHHPDANGGDKASEERFKQINEAYRTVLLSLTA